MAGRLSPKRILVVEDIALIARAMSMKLEAAGAEVVGPASTLEKATALAESESLDAALLDVDLRGVLSYPLARTLNDRGTPVVLMTGYDPSTFPDDLRHLRHFDKLGDIEELISLLEGAIDRSTNRV